MKVASCDAELHRSVLHKSGRSRQPIMMTRSACNANIGDGFVPSLWRTTQRPCWGWRFYALWHMCRGTWNGLIYLLHLMSQSIHIHKCHMHAKFIQNTRHATKSQGLRHWPTLLCIINNSHEACVGIMYIYMGLHKQNVGKRDMDEN